MGTHPAQMAPSRRDLLPHLAAPALALVAALILMAPLPWTPGSLLGHPMGELANHHWMLWRAMTALQPPLENLPAGVKLPLMDPVNLLFYALPGRFNPVAGTTAVYLGNLLLAFAGGHALARALGASRAGALVAGLSAQTAPFLQGVAVFGITESLPVGWLGLHLAAVVHFEREGRGRMVVAAGLCLGAFALSGWYHAAFGLVVEAVLLAWLALRSPRRLPGLLAQGGLALGMVLPALRALLAASSTWGGRFLTPRGLPPEIRSGWREAPHYGTDLLNLVLPSLHAVDVPRTVYLGLVSVGLALVAGRRARLLWAIAVPLWLLSLGYWLSLGGHTRFFGHAWGLPAGWLARELPHGNAISHWYRAAGPATMVLAAAAGLGADRLLVGRGRLALLGLLGVLGLDAIGLSQVAWPRPTTDPTPPAIYAALSGEGAVVQLPVDATASSPYGPRLARPYNLWQPAIGRAVAENYEGLDEILRRNRLIAVADAACGLSIRRPRGQTLPEGATDPAPLEVEGALEREVAALRRMGVGWVVLHRDRAATPDAAAVWLDRALGAPMAVEDAWAWQIED